MKIMLKHLGISVLLVCMFALTKAQDAQMPSAEARASKMTEWMKTNLNLTADQLGKVQEINMKYAVRMDSLRTSVTESQARSVAIKTDSDEKDAELKGILTSDQYKAYLEKKQEMKEKYKDKMKDKSQGGQ